MGARRFDSFVRRRSASANETLQIIVDSVLSAWILKVLKSVQKLQYWFKKCLNDSYSMQTEKRLKSSHKAAQFSL